MPLKVTSKHKILRDMFSKMPQNLYIENYKTLLKETKEIP